MTITPKAIEIISDKIGEIQTNPPTNSMLDRLKRITTETLIVAETHESLGGFWPEPGTLTTTTPIGDPTDYKIDSRGNLSIRGPMTTDEGSFREDFSGTTIYKVIAGTITFTNNSKVITGVASTFTNGLIQYADYIKLSTDSDTTYAKILSIISDTELLLENVYTGSTATGTGYHAKFVPIIGAGGAITVASSICTITSGTTINSLTRISRDIDYGPLVMAVNASISVRRSNQIGYIGLTDDAIAPTISAYFQFDGTSVTTIKTVTQFSADPTDIESNTIVLVALSSVSKRYKIELAQEYVSFYVDDVLVSAHKNHIPSPYVYMQAMLGWVNTGTVVGTSLMQIDTIFIGNIDALQVMSGMGNLPVIISNPPIAPAFISTSGFEISLVITRPSDIIPYSINDLINNSVGSTTLPQFNFSVLGNLNYRFIEVTSVTIISNNGAASPKLAPYLHLFNVNNPGFAVTDNSPFLPTYTSLVNYRALSIGPSFTAIDTGDLCYLLTTPDKPMILKLSSSSRIFLALVNSSPYIPIADETIKVILKGRI